MEDLGSYLLLFPGIACKIVFNINKLRGEWLLENET
jgi:hypothetical protein